MFRIVSKKPSIIWATETEIDDERLDSKFYDVQFIETQNKLLKSPLTKKKLGEIMKSMNSPIGWQGIPSSAYRRKGEGIPLLRVQNIQDNQIDWDTIIDVDPEIYFSQPAIQSEAGDIIITRVGTIGRFCKVPSNVPKIAMGQNLTRVSFDRQVVDADYILAYMNTQYCINQMYRLAYGGVQPSLTNKNIRDILLLIPSIKIQNYIGNKVRKAEELREESKRLKEEAESLLSLVLKLDEFKYEVTKSWVVNADLLEPYLNVQFYNKEYLSFQEHLKTLGIPLLKMSQVLFKIIRNNSPDENDRVEKGIPSLIVSDIDPYRIEIENAKIQVSQDYYKANEHQAIRVDDVVYTTAGPPLGEACLVVDEMLPLLSGAHVAVLRTNEKCKPGYLTCVLNSLVGSLEVQKHSYGIRQQYLFNEQLSNFVIPIIAQEIQDEIHEKISKAIKFEIQSKKFISEAKQDVENLIEGKFDESKISEGA
ncbi:restriction endonuclease subunit S [Ureibacillus terrenus]|uniref:Type I restriction modification DNA specificity domain-containing protein n=1 Tax=Ureibacillus terrenus TaxID=118246 RepID=A0A540UX33_9BACL|nr:restriction endonuclease subunit S [Ureibacillus terrenus]TQE89031.1 hypothetical protein FKZ59_12905 [Ureibacillus terrenus]